MLPPKSNTVINLLPLHRYLRQTRCAKRLQPGISTCLHAQAVSTTAIWCTAGCGACSHEFSPLPSLGFSISLTVALVVATTKHTVWNLTKLMASQSADDCSIKNPVRLDYQKPERARNIGSVCSCTTAPTRGDPTKILWPLSLLFL